MGSVILLSVLFIAALGFFTYTDVKEMTDQFPSSPNLMLVADEDALLSGLVILPQTDDADLLDSMSALDPDDKAELDLLLSEGDKESMLDVVKTSDFYSAEEISANKLYEDTYKIIFIDLDITINDPPMEEVIREIYSK